MRSFWPHVAAFGRPNGASWRPEWLLDAPMKRKGRQRASKRASWEHSGFKFCRKTKFRQNFPEQAISWKIIILPQQNNGFCRFGASQNPEIPYFSAKLYIWGISSQNFWANLAFACENSTVVAALCALGRANPSVLAQNNLLEFLRSFADPKLRRVF